MSDTPITDEEKFNAQDGTDQFYQHGTKWFVPAFVAEELERALRDLVKALEDNAGALYTSDPAYKKAVSVLRSHGDGANRNDSAVIRSFPKS